MRAMVAEAMEAGAAGVSSSNAPTHLDLDDKPVPSRMAERREMLELAEEAGKAGAGSIAYLPFSAIGGIDATDEDYLIELGKVSGYPVVIQGLGGRNKTDAPTATWEAAVSFLDRSTEAGAPVFSMLIARPFDRPVVIDESNFHYLSVASWNAMLMLPKEEKLAVLRDPAARDEMRTAVENYNRDPAKGTTNPPPLWTAVYVDEVTLPEHQKFQSRSIADVAEELGKAPADAMLDLALDEDLATRFRWRTESPEWTEAVSEAQRDPRMIIGVSDGGAHLARDDGADWSSYFLGRWVRDRKVWSLEEGIRQITADAGGARRASYDRGVIKPGGARRRDDLRPRDHRPLEEGVRARPPRRRRPVQGVGPGRAGDDRQRRADRAARRAHRAPSRTGRAPRMTSTLDAHDLRTSTHAVDLRRRRAHRRAHERVRRPAAGEVPRLRATCDPARRLVRVPLR